MGRWTAKEIWHKLTGWATQALTKRQQHTLVFSHLSTQVEEAAWNNENELLQIPYEKDETNSLKSKTDRSDEGELKGDPLEGHHLRALEAWRALSREDEKCPL